MAVRLKGTESSCQAKRDQVTQAKRDQVTVKLKGTKWLSG